MRWPKVDGWRWDMMRSPDTRGRLGVIVDLEVGALAIALWVWRRCFRVFVWWRPCRFCADADCTGQPCIHHYNSE